MEMVYKNQHPRLGEDDHDLKAKERFAKKYKDELKSKSK